MNKQNNNEQSTVAQIINRSGFLFVTPEGDGYACEKISVEKIRSNVKYIFKTAAGYQLTLRTKIPPTEIREVYQINYTYIKAN